MPGVSMRRYLFLLIAVTLLATSAFAQTIKGQYVETRSADIYVGQCFANGEVGLAGDEAIVAWHIQEGKWDGVSLAGLSVVGAHPVWYGGVMVRRGLSFFKLARVPITNPEAPVSHTLDVANTAPAWTNPPSEFLAKAELISAGAKTALSTDAQTLRIESDETKYGVQIVSTPIAIEKHHDYLLRLPLKLEDGRVMVRVTDAKQNAVLASTDVDLNEGLTSLEQPVNNLALPFVSDNESQICVSLANNAPVSARSVAEVGRLELFDLGPSSQGWMRYTRFPIRTLQKVFVTAAVLPCVILGIFALLWTRNLRPLILLLLVPAYYVIFQSALHTERRYVIVIHYFTLIFAAIFLSGVFRLVKHGLISLSPARQTSS